MFPLFEKITLILYYPRKVEKIVVIIFLLAGKICLSTNRIYLFNFFFVAQEGFLGYWLV